MENEGSMKTSHYRSIKKVHGREFFVPLEEESSKRLLDSGRSASSQIHDKVKASIEAIDISHIRTRALECHQRAATANVETEGDHQVTCTIDNSVLGLGWANLVFEINFSDGVVLIARIWTNTSGLFTTDYEELKGSLESEVETMQYVADHSRIPVPTVLHYDFDAYNPVGRPYMIMTAIGGRTLDRMFTEIPTESQHNFLSQLADYITQLHKMTFPEIGRLRYDGKSVTVEPNRPEDGPYFSSVHYVYSLRSRLMPAIREDTQFGYTNEDKEIACWVLLQAALGSLIPAYISGPFPLCHRDLHYKNIIVDKDFNITGIIDWFGAGTTPQEEFASIRGFRAPLMNHENKGVYDECYRLFIECLEQRESGLNAINELSVAGWVATDKAYCFELGLDRSPWRAVTVAKALVEILSMFGKRRDWVQIKEIYRDSILFKP